MANLFDILDPNAQAPSAPPASIPSLANAQGLPNVPIAPVGAATIGAGPDQAKMAGTPAQKKAIIQPGQEYTTAVRREQQSKAITAPEQQLLDVTAKWKAKFGSFGDDVAAAVQTALTTATATPAVATIDKSGYNEALRAKGIAPDSEQDKAARAAFATFAAAKPDENGNYDEATNKAIADFKAITGMAPSGLAITADKQNELAAALAQKAPDQISVADLMKARPDVMKDLTPDMFGLTSWDGKSVDDLQKLVNAKLQTGYSETAKLQAALNDPGLSANDRAEIRRRLGALGATGIRASEHEINDLRGAIDRADLVEYNGAMVELKDLLSDGALTSTMLQYLDGSNPKALDNIPGLKQFVDSNKDLLIAATAKLSEGETKFDALQTALKSILEPKGLIFANDDERANWKTVLKGLSGQDNLDVALSQGKVDALNTMPAMQYMQELLKDPANAQKAHAFAADLMDVQKTGLLDTVKGFTLDDWKNLRNDDGTKWAKVKTFLTDRKTVLDGTNPADVFNLLFTDETEGKKEKGFSALDVAKRSFKSAQTAVELGKLTGKTDAKAEALIKLLDPDGNGVFETGDTAEAQANNAQIKEGMRKLSLSEILALGGGKQDFRAPPNPLNLTSPTQVNADYIAKAIDNRSITDPAKAAELRTAYGPAAVEGALNKKMNDNTTPLVDSTAALRGMNVDALLDKFNTSTITAANKTVATHLNKNAIIDARNTYTQQIDSMISDLQNKRDSGFYNNTIINNMINELSSKRVEVGDKLNALIAPILAEEAKGREAAAKRKIPNMQHLF